MSSILIVDDERDIRELIGDILRDEGFSVRLAGNSDDCMAEINAEPPALMILDIWLKDSRMDGIDILKSVKRDNPDVPVVIISGMAILKSRSPPSSRAPMTSSKSPSTSTS
jgi:two-component system nitrogen regulation response regulator NtrX